MDNIKSAEEYLGIDLDCAALEDVLHGREGYLISRIRKTLAAYHTQFTPVNKGEDGKYKEDRKEYLANKLELILRDAVNSFLSWRSECGVSGWYNITGDATQVKNIFRQPIIDSAKSAISIYKVQSLPSNVKKDEAYIKQLEDALKWYADSDNYLTESDDDARLATAYQYKNIETKAKQALQHKK